MPATNNGKPKKPRVVLAPAKRHDILDITAILDRNRELEAMLAALKGHRIATRSPEEIATTVLKNADDGVAAVHAALAEARAFVANPYRWKGHNALALKHRLDEAIASLEE